jgi:hypothetical protein
MELPKLWSDEKNDVQFLRVKLLARQFLAIHGSQIETKHIFGFVVILTLLWACKLGTSNLDSLIMIYKNWPIDVQTINHLWVENDVWIFFVTKEDFLDDYKSEIKEVSLFEELI